MASPTPLPFPFLLLLLLLPSSSSSSEQLLVHTADGPVLGSLLPVPSSSSSSSSSSSFAAAFLGIPYAEPPVGPLRFRPPRPARPWSLPLDASSHRSACFQAVDTTFPGFAGAEMWNPAGEMSEDCLYLNVWLPSPRPPRLIPVLVWIYGGGFYSGAASLDVYDGRVLAASQAVAVVSMNYRVGALGFLALPGHPEAPGNAGLWDQRLALRWVQRNIRAFGGDPRAVTLFGESAGAASVGIHLLAPGSRGLFRRAVLQSGSPNGPWATVGAAESRRRAAALAMELGCGNGGGGGGDSELVACLRERPAPELVRGEAAVLPQESVFRFAFVPVVDGDFLPESPEVLLGAEEAGTAGAGSRGDLRGAGGHGEGAGSQGGGYGGGHGAGPGAEPGGHGDDAGTQGSSHGGTRGAVRGADAGIHGDDAGVHGADAGVHGDDAGIHGADAGPQRAVHGGTRGAVHGADAGVHGADAGVHGADAGSQRAVHGGTRGAVRGADAGPHGADAGPQGTEGEAGIDILLGAVQDEGTYFLVYGVPGFGKDNESLISRDDFLKGVRMGVPQGNEVVAAAVELQYTDWLDQDNPVKNREALGAIVGDHNVVCPLMEFALRWAERGRGRVYAFLFEHRASTLLWPQWMGVPHGYEIEFVFGQPLRPELNYTEEEKRLSRRMMGYWGNFARMGDPNGREEPGTGPRWPRFTVRGQGYARLNTNPLSQGKGLRAQACAFWTRFLPKLLHATGPMEEAERQWRQEFHRWSSYMGRWKSHFEHYSRMEPCQQL